MKISYMTKTRTLGPGERCAIWLQGCKKRCVGCINPEGQSLDGGYEVSVDQLLSEIMKYENIVGVTISGGEPFLQFAELLELINRIKEVSELDIMLFSGYELSEINKLFPDCMKLLNKIDIFIDGEYLENKNDNSMYRGSSNQNIYCFTEKYKIFHEEIRMSKHRDFSFEIKENGDVFFIGIPPKELYEDFLEKIGGAE